MPNEVDAELGRRMSNGDEDAFASFYDRFAPGLFSLICGILRDQKESEDVLQEAFVQMWKRIVTYDARRSSLFTWAVMHITGEGRDPILSLLGPGRGQRFGASGKRRAFGWWIN